MRLGRALRRAAASIYTAVIGAILLLAVLLYLYFHPKPLKSLEYQALATALSLAAVLLSTSLL